MNGFLSVFKRELKGYFSTPLAYVFLVVFLLAGSLMTFQRGFFEMRHASLRLFFEAMPVLFIFLVPAMAMRLWAEERRSNSIELLFSLPITIPQAVLAKFFACWAVLALALVLTCPMVFTVAYLGDPDPGPIISGYLGALLLAGAYLAIGSFFSCLTRNQVIAFILAVTGCLFLVLAGWPPVTQVLTSWAPAAVVDFVAGFSVMTHFDSIQRGVLDTGDLVYFASVIVFGLAATDAALKFHRGG